MKTIPNTLREHRLRKGLAQWDVAVHLGFRSTDRISRWENGIMYPHVTNFIKLIELYKATPKELYPEVDDTMV
jgi:transcriptional regulator with XRE-family HTH domain